MARMRVALPSAPSVVPLMLPLATAAGTILAVGLLYLDIGLPISLLVALAIVALAAIDPVGPLVVVGAALGLIYHPVYFHTLEFNPAEVVLVATCGGIALRALSALVRERASAVMPFLSALYVALRRGFGPIALALLLVGTFSLFTVADPSHLHESIREYRWVIVEPVIYLFLLRWYFGDNHRRRLAAVFYVGGACLTSVYAIIALAHGSGLAVEGVVRISGTFPHPNDLALYLVRVVPFAVALAIAYRARFDYRWLATAAICGAALLLTFSRGALVGAGIAVVLVAWWGRRRRLSAALGVAAVAVGGLLTLTAGSRILSLFSGGSGSARVEIWRSALAMERDHPIFGVGLDQFLYQYAPRYVAPAAWDERFTSHPHNLILDVWLRLGIMGLVVAAAYVVVVFRGARRAIRQRSCLGLAALGALVAGAIHGMVDNGYFLPGLALAFWFLTALLELEAMGSEARKSATESVVR